LVWILKGDRLLEDLGLVWENNIKIDLQEVECEHGLD
jgi:hypothetical protein